MSIKVSAVSDVSAQLCSNGQSAAEFVAHAALKLAFIPTLCAGMFFADSLARLSL